MKVADIVDFDRISWEELPQAKRIAEWMRLKHPKAKILDVGCGPGLYVLEMRLVGLDAFGVDSDERLIEGPYLKRADITTDLPAFDADVMLSLEVGEHIPAEKAEAYLDYIDAPLVYFSAARPGQGGEGHINCQPKAYWVEKFNHTGYWLNPDATDEWLHWMRQGPHMGWLTQNGMVFRRD